MSNFYIIESPLQALCALEVSLASKGENFIVVRLSGGEHIRNDEQIISIVSKREWDYLYFMDCSRRRFRIQEYIYERRVLTKIEALFKNKIDYFYIGDFRSSFMHIMKCAVNAEKDILLDDGTVTIEIVNNYLSQGLFYPANKFFKAGRNRKKLMRLFVGKYINKERMSQRMGVCTAYNKLNYNDILPVSFTNVKKLFYLERTIDDSLVYFYGSKYSEEGILSLTYELSFLKKVSEYYHSKGKVVIYFAHRAESKSKLDTIKNDLGFSDVFIPNQTAEVFLLESEKLPYEISSACSSVLVNSSVVFPEIMLRSFRIELGEVPEKYKDGIDISYKYFETVGIPIEVLS